jgi:hypothetical protein
MKTEQIQEHWLQDIYRLENGTLLTVNKFANVNWHWNSKIKEVKKEKIKGIKNCYRIKEDITYWGVEYKAGQLFLEGKAINELDPVAYLYRITSNDGIHGDFNYIKQITEEINKIVKKYQ